MHQTESDSHLEKYILQQLKKHNVEPKKWKKVIFNFCKEVSSKVILDEKRDKLDVRKYVHIKVMHEEEGKEVVPNHSKYYSGVVFKKHVAHKSMNTKIEKPRILVYDGSIEYSTLLSVQKFVTFENLVSSEEQYLKNVVERIASLKPNLLIVSKSISRTALQLLLEKGITCVRNVKTSLLYRTARFVGAKVIKLNNFSNAQLALGTCPSFYVSQFKSLSGKKVSFVFFDGTFPQLGGTLLLRGDSLNNLLKVKQILQVIPTLSPSFFTFS